MFPRKIKDRIFLYITGRYSREFALSSTLKRKSGTPFKTISLLCLSNRSKFESREDFSFDGNKKLFGQELTFEK